MKLTIEPLSNSYQKERLLSNLYRIFGEFDTTMLTMLEPLLEWVEVGGGEILFQEHDPGNCLYFVISGRLKASVTDANGQQQVIGEIVRGETVGEMAIFTGDPRSATITALRDSVLVKLSKVAFEQVITAYPAVSMNVTKLIINRLRTSQGGKQAPKKPVNICVLSLHNTIDPAQFTEEICKRLRAKGSIYIASSTSVDTFHNQPGLAQADKMNPGPYRHLTQWLDEQESQHEFVLYLADPLTDSQQLTEWTHRCLRQGDEILLLADARQPHHLTPLEQRYQKTALQASAAQTLVLMHQPDTTVPRHTANWLAIRPTVKAHYHLRTGLSRDLDRMARILSGNAVGLVLAGGGAKGFAHVGVVQALQEFGIPIDVVGGTSVGGLLAGVISFDETADVLTRHMRKAAQFNPTKDYNLFPFISLIRGKRMKQMIQTAIADFTGHPDTDIEDSWLTLFTLSSNYTRAREEIHTRGSLTKYLQATSAIPGVFPPVIDGNDLLVDGGTFNNFPADVMSRFGAGKVIGVDLIIDKPRKLTIDRIPSPNALLRDRFRPKPLKKYRLPSLVSIMLNTTLLYSSARRSETVRYTDLYFNPDVSRYGLMNWSSFDEIVAKGYEHARDVLSRLCPEEIAALRGH